MRNLLCAKASSAYLLTVGLVTFSLVACGGGAVAPPISQARPLAQAATLARPLECDGECDGSPTPTPTLTPTPQPSTTPTGQITETGAVAQTNPYGPRFPMVVLHPGAPYDNIDVYHPAAGSFQKGQRLVATGTYHSGGQNRWIIAATLTLASSPPSPMPSPTSTIAPSPTPSPSSNAAIQHIELVLMENTGYDSVVGNTANMPFINNTLIPQGKLFTNSYSLDHPSLPNYLGLYAGNEEGTTGTDACPLSFSGPTLGSELSAAGRTFIGYAESMPGRGSTACSSPDGLYQGHHSPWIYFPGGAAFGQPYNGFPGSMPDVAFIVPNNCHNMHDSCGGNTWLHGDAYLSQQLPAIIAWNQSHNGLLIVTWDESAYSTSPANHIVTIMVGPMVTKGISSQPITHYNVLRTITDTFGLAPLNNAPAIMP